MGVKEGWQEGNGGQGNRHNLFEPIEIILLKQGHGGQGNWQSFWTNQSKLMNCRDGD
jgi:hypothetical protein